MDPQRKRHAFGQHFLKDKNIARLIADTAVKAAVEYGCPALLEVGPGKGAITDPILERVSKEPRIGELILAERDRDLAAFWREKAPSKTRVEEGDFLDLPEERWLAKTPLAVASNLPYSAGTAIVIRLARLPEKIPVMVLMFQAEVARRLRAEQGTKDWGSLSIWIQNRWNVKKLCFVPPGAFHPPPKVDSEVVTLTPREKPLVDVARDPRSEETWDALLRLCFAHRRKMLRAGLPKSGLWRNTLDASGVDGTKRAEALSWEEWQRLYRAAIDASSKG